MLWIWIHLGEVIQIQDGQSFPKQEKEIKHIEDLLVLLELWCLKEVFEK